MERRFVRIRLPESRYELILDTAIPSEPTFTVICVDIVAA